jgi:RHS repeat-associated protein
MKSRLIFSIYVVLFSSVCGWAQFSDTSPETGENPLGSYFKTEIDSISLTNGNLHLTIPVFSLPGREVPVALVMDYNSQSYELRSTYLSNGQQVGSYESKQWRKLSSLFSGTVTATRTYVSHAFANNLYTLHWRLSFVWTSPTGRQITFVTVDRTQTCTSIWNNSPNPPTCNQNPSPTDAQIFDNAVATSSDPDFITFLSGTVVSNPYASSGSVIRKDGTRLPALSPVAGAGVPALTTTNGNQLQGNAASQSTDNFGLALSDDLPGTDTVGRTITYTNDDDHANYSAWFNTLETITLTDANGQAQVYLIKWKPVAVNNTYEESGYPDQNDVHKMVDYIQLPNGKRYTLTYNSEGMVSKVTLPSGAYIRYEYEHPCGHRGHVVRRLASSDGTTGAEKQTSYSYGYTLVSGFCNTVNAFYPIQSTTVTDPTGVQTQHIFTILAGQPLEAAAITISASQIAKRVDRTWVYTTYNDPIGGAHSYPELRTETTTMDSMVRKAQYTYDSHQNLTRQEDFDWALNAPGPRLRYMDKTYLDSACISSGVCNRVLTEKIYTDSGTLSAETDYEYDNYSGSNALVARSGTIPGWTSPTGTRGNVTAVKLWLNTNSSWVTTIQQYDVLGNKVKVTDPAGHATNTDFTDRFSDNVSRNTFAFPTRATDPSGFYVDTTYHFNTGLVTQTKDSLNRATTKTYDAMNRLLQQNYPNGGFTRYTYDDTQLTAKKEVKVDNAGNLGTAISHYDGLYREFQRETYDPEGTIFVDTQYDANGRKWKVSNPRRSAETAVWTQLAYDALDRPTVTTAPDNSTTQYAYNGNQTTITDETGNQRRYTHDGLGQLIKVEEPNPSLATPVVTTHTYNVLGKLTQSSQGSQSRTWAFDSLGRMTSETLPESGTKTFTYNSDNLLSTKTDARNITTTITYHSTHVHEIGTRAYSDGTPTVSFNYNTQGLRSSMTDALGSVSYSYDANTDYLTQESRTLTGVTGTFTTTYAYNIKGDLTTVTYPSGRVVNSTYAAGGGCCNSRLSSVVDQTTSATMANGLTFDAAGEMLTRTLNPGTNAIQEGFGYNNRRQQTQITASVGSTSLMNFAYNYGTSSTNTGRALSRTDAVQPEHSVFYSYDSLYRLSQVTAQDANWDISWNFDAWGNRTAQSPRGLATSKVGTQVSGYSNNRDTSYTYDAAGNETNDGSHTYTFNADNRITQMDAGAAVYVYDGEGRRMKKTVGSESTYYFYGLGGLLCEFTSSNAISTATAASSTDRAVYRTSDKVGSAVLVINSSGIVIENNRTLPYGEQWLAENAPSVNNQKFTTYDRDPESGLDYAMARYYANRSGRFMSVDPGSRNAKMELSQSWNAYIYSENDPINYTDPGGDARGTIVKPALPETRCDFPEYDRLTDVQKSMIGADYYNALDKSQRASFLNITGAMAKAGVSLEGLSVTRVDSDRIILSQESVAILHARVEETFSVKTITTTIPKVGTRQVQVRTGPFAADKPSEKYHKGMSDWGYRQNVGRWALQIGGGVDGAFIDIDSFNPKGILGTLGHIFGEILPGGKTNPFEVGKALGADVVGYTCRQVTK